MGWFGRIWVCMVTGVMWGCGHVLCSRMFGMSLGAALSTPLYLCVQHCHCTAEQSVVRVKTFKGSGGMGLAYAHVLFSIYIYACM